MSDASAQRSRGSPVCALQGCAHALRSCSPNALPPTNCLSLHSSVEALNWFGLIFGCIAACAESRAPSKSILAHLYREYCSVSVPFLLPDLLEEHCTLRACTGSVLVSQFACHGYMSVMTLSPSVVTTWWHESPCVFHCIISTVQHCHTLYHTEQWRASTHAKHIACSTGPRVVHPDSGIDLLDVLSEQSWQ